MDDSNVGILRDNGFIVSIMMHQFTVQGHNNVWKGITHHMDDVLNAQTVPPGQLCLFVNSDYWTAHGLW
jgi:hypothetical protein